MAALSVSKPPTERWEVAKKWRDGGTPTMTMPSPTDRDAEDGDGALEADPSSACSEERVVRLAVLRTCFSEPYGLHIPRMFDDLLVVLAETFPAAAAAEAAATRAQEEDAAAGTRPEDNLGVGDSTPLAGGDGRLGETGGRNWPLSPPVFHVTEYDVTRGQYPESWEKVHPARRRGERNWGRAVDDHASHGGQGSAGVWQVIAQALGGLVRRRAGPRKHYALQESELLVEPKGCPGMGAVSAAVESVRREKEGGGGEGGRGQVGGQGGEEVPAKMRLLYHHNDEVVELPPGAVNISTSRHCLIHGMIMDDKGEDGEPPRPNLLTFQAHPELNYEYGRRVMEGMLDADVKAGRLTHEKARRLKEQVSAWDHKEFPLALELMRRLFQPIVPRENGGFK
eukprot:jgi/Undpi1/2216/HiC_scaffold_12.g05602.m1